MNVYVHNYVLRSRYKTQVVLRSSLGPLPLINPTLEVTAVLTTVTIVLPFLKLQINGMTVTLFCVWLLVLPSMSVKFIHFAACFNGLSFVLCSIPLNEYTKFLYPLYC